MEAAREYGIRLAITKKGWDRVGAAKYIDKYHSACFCKTAHECPWMPPSESQGKTPPMGAAEGAAALPQTNPSSGPSPISLEDEICAIHHIVDEDTLRDALGDRGPPPVSVALPLPYSAFMVDVV